MADPASPLQTDPVAEHDLRRLQQARSLERSRFFATALLVLMALVYLLSRRFEPAHPGLAYVAAFAEAAMVGALADWFAVVALFRHPMGVPLPHTAIIPRNKGRIADNLGAFISNNFLRTDVILQRIREVDPGRRLAAWLSQRQSAEAVAGYGARALQYLLQSVEDERVLRFLQSAVMERLGRVDVAPLAGRVLELVAQPQRVQQLLERLLALLRELLARPQTQDKIAELIAREFESWRRFMLGMQIDQSIGDYSGRKLVGAAMRLLDEVEADPSHPLRLRFEAMLREFIERLKNDREFKARGEQIRDELLAHPQTAEWLQQAWHRLRDRAERDLGEPQSQIRTRLAIALRELGEQLCDDRGMQSWVNEQLLAAAGPLCEAHRDGIGRFIASQVKAWDERYMVREFELNIGRDLQFIRINGTIIGGLAGLAIYLATQFLRG